MDMMKTKKESMFRIKKRLQVALSKWKIEGNSHETWMKIAYQAACLLFAGKFRFFDEDAEDLALYWVAMGLGLDFDTRWDREKLQRIEHLYSFFLFLRGDDHHTRLVWKDELTETIADLAQLGNLRLRDDALNVIIRYDCENGPLVGAYMGYSVMGAKGSFFVSWDRSHVLALMPKGYGVSGFSLDLVCGTPPHGARFDWCQIQHLAPERLAKAVQKALIDCCDVCTFLSLHDDEEDRCSEALRVAEEIQKKGLRFFVRVEDRFPQQPALVASEYKLVWWDDVPPFFEDETQGEILDIWENVQSYL